MLSQTLKPVAWVLILLYLFSSTVLYFIIEYAYDKEAYKRIEQTVNFEKSIHKYVSQHQKTAVYELIKDANYTHEYFDPRLLSSTFISQEIFKNYNARIENENRGVKLRIVSDNPTNINNKTNDYEQKILKEFRKKKHEDYFEYIEEEGKGYLFYAQSVGVNTPKCLQCHGKFEDAPDEMIERYGKHNGFNENLGDMRAIIALYTPIDEDKQEMYTVLCLILFLALIVFVSIFLIIVYFTKQLIEKDKLITKQSKFAAMGEMIGMIAHQWRQPLTGIGMTVDNLLLDIELETVDEKLWTENLKSIKKQVFYLSHTVDDFRNFFKPNQEAKEINIGELMDESIQIIQSSLDKNKVKLHKVYQNDVLLITFRNDLVQVILNLMKNANDAFLENEILKGEIYIGIRQFKGKTEIEISDNAGGINEDILEKIFDPYFSTKDEKNGTGLGLYMSKMIIEGNLGGTLDVETDTSGTSFVIVLSNLQKGH